MEKLDLILEANFGIIIRNVLPNKLASDLIKEAKSEILALIPNIKQIEALKNEIEQLKEESIIIKSKSECKRISIQKGVV